MFRKPNYFFVVFGEAHRDTYPVDGGVYSHDANYITSSGITLGDVILLYCCGNYPKHNQEIPGLGIVTSIETDGIHYQYLPFCHPVSWSAFQPSVPDLQELGKINWTLKGNWLRKISSISFRTTIGGRQIDWP